MKCDIEGCIHKARWIVDDNGVDTNLCPKHLEEHNAWKTRFEAEKESAGLP